jgi:hypothetical protein
MQFPDFGREGMAGYPVDSVLRHSHTLLAYGWQANVNVKSEM